MKMTRNNEEVSSGRGSECRDIRLMPPSGWHAKWPAWVNAARRRYHSYRGIRSDGGGEWGDRFEAHIEGIGSVAATFSTQPQKEVCHE